MKYLLLLLLFSGCGISVSGHLDPVEIKPVTLNHTFEVNFQQALAYCQQQCDAQYTDVPTQTTCTQACYSQFLTVFGAAISTAFATPTPTP